MTNPLLSVAGGPPTRGTASRLAIVSTPRSGNTWLRRLLAVRYGLEEAAAHTPDELPATPGDRSIVQIHWDRHAELQPYLERHGFGVVTVARHPFDVLISILHFVDHEPETARWLGADHTSGLRGADPTSDRFRDFATGEGARRLLSVTPTWWHRSGVTRVTYESLVSDTAGVLVAIDPDLGLAPAASLDEAIEAASFREFAALPNRHGWRATPGLWRSLVTAELAAELADAHRDALEVGGYDTTADPELTPERARRTWDELRIP